MKNGTNSRQERYVVYTLRGRVKRKNKKTKGETALVWKEGKQRETRSMVCQTAGKGWRCSGVDYIELH